MFLPIRNYRTGVLDEAMTGGGIYAMVLEYGKKTGIAVDGLSLHALRATAATNALEHQADIACIRA